MAIPNPAEMLVLAWPAPKAWAATSYESRRATRNRSEAVERKRARSGARESALRNEFDPAAAYHAFLVEVGLYDASATPVFVPLPEGIGGNAVRVEATDAVDHNFVPGDTPVWAEAIAMIETNSSLRSAKSTVLFKNSWHKGVIGIVAARCIEKY